MHGPLERASAAHLEAAVREELAGTFFTMNLDRARSALVARAMGAQRRAAPAVAATARRDDRGARAARALERRPRSSTRKGEVFVADYNGDLPQFEGPDGCVAAGDGALSRLGADARAARAHAGGHPAVAARRVASRGAGRGGRARDRARARGSDGAPRAFRDGLRPHDRHARARRHAHRRTSIFAIATDSRRGCPDSANGRRRKPDGRRSRTREWDSDGEGREERDRRPRHRHVEDRRDRRRGRGGRRLQHHRARHAAVARAQEGRGRQHRGDDGVDPARAGGGRADGGMPDHRGVHRDRRQPHQEPQFERHGRDQGEGSHAGRHRPRRRDGEGDRDSERPADPAHPAAGIHHRRPGGRARAAGDERRAPRGQGAHRHRRGLGGREHHQVRPPLRARGERRDPAAARLVDRRVERRREGARDLPHGHRRRHDRSRRVRGRRDPAHRGDPDRRRPGDERHRDDAAHADEGGRGAEAAPRLRAAPARRPERHHRGAGRGRPAAAQALAADARRSHRAADRGALHAGAGGAAALRLRGAALVGNRADRRLGAARRA